MKNYQNSEQQFVPSILKVIASEDCEKSVAEDFNSESDKTIEELLNDQEENPKENNKQ